MKEFIAILGAILLGIVLVAAMIGVGGNTNGSLAGSANTLVQGVMTDVSGIAP
jgi:hypothetical protein